MQSTLLRGPDPTNRRGWHASGKCVACSRCGRARRGDRGCGAQTTLGTSNDACIASANSLGSDMHSTTAGDTQPKRPKYKEELRDASKCLACVSRVFSESE